MNRTRPANTPSYQSTFLLAAVTALASLTTLAAPSITHASLLGTAGAYNEFILGNSTRSNTDVQGKVAIGGNANFSNFTVASLQPTITTNLVVGGTLGAQSASVRGHILTGGNATYTTPTVMGDFSSNGSLTLGSGGTVNGNIRYSTVFNQNGSTIGGSITGGVSTPLPVNFATEGAYLTALSAAQVNVLDPSPSFMFSQMFLTGGAGANYFNVTGAQIASAGGGFNITSPAGSTVVINVSGTGFTIPNTGFNLSGGITVDHLLWNFYEATSLTIQGSARGSFLAPQATISTSFGAFNGNLIAAALSGSIETHIFNDGSGPPTLFDGTLRPVPEPGSFVLLAAVGGALAVAHCGRRRRTDVAADAENRD